MNSNRIEEFKQKLKLSKEQKEIIVGLMLGDGCLESQNNGRTYRLKVEQSFLHKEYADWLYEKLENFVLTEPKVKFKRIKEKRYKNYGFQTVSCANLRFFAHQFYEKDSKRKKIPKTIRKLLTPLSLAVWFMDDGQIKSKKHRTLLINVQCFSRKDLYRLQLALEDKFGIETKLSKDKKGYRMYFLSRTIDKFLRIVLPNMLVSMEYKLGINIMPKK